MAIRYCALAFAHSDPDALTDALLEAKVLPQCTAPTGVLPGTVATGHEFTEEAAAAIAFRGDRALLMNFSFTFDLLCISDLSHPHHLALLRLSTRGPVIAALVGHGNHVLRAYRDGAMVREIYEVEGDASRSVGARLPGELPGDWEADRTAAMTFGESPDSSAWYQVNGALRRFLGSDFMEWTNEPFAVYATSRDALTRFGARAEWGRGSAAVFVKGAPPGEELELAQQIFPGAALSSTEPAFTALEASVNHGDLVGAGYVGGLAMLYPGYYKTIHSEQLATPGALAARLSTSLPTLIVYWDEGGRCAFLARENGRTLRHFSVDGEDVIADEGSPLPSEPMGGSFELKVRAACRDVLGVSVSWLFGPTVVLRALDVPADS
jgi:hypothetical protein